MARLCKNSMRDCKQYATACRQMKRVQEKGERGTKDQRGREHALAG